MFVYFVVVAVIIVVVVVVDYSPLDYTTLENKT